MTQQENKYDVSVICPGVRYQYLTRLYHQIAHACQRYKFELIFAGPHSLPQELQYIPNVKYIKDLGTPSRSFQMALLLSEGRFTTWACDDCLAYEQSIDSALDLLLSNDVNSETDMVAMRYCEGINHSAPPHPDEYYTAGYHGDLRIPGIDPNWPMPIIILMDTKYYYKLGGLDCRFEFFNLNVHDLSWRAVRNGSKCYLSPDVVYNANWTPKTAEGGDPSMLAYVENDLPLLRKIYDPNNLNDNLICIDLNNWKINSDAVWHRKSKEY